MNRILLIPFALTLLCLFCATGAQAQLILAKGEYRIVELDKPNQRFGIAQLEAKPDRRQNWVYVKATTKFRKRTQLDEETFRVQKFTYDEFFATIKKGDIVKVKGGRGWTGSITAKEVSF